MTRYFPDYNSFESLAEGVDLVPVYRQLVGDTLTPVSAYCKIQQGACSFLFESVVGGEKIGRFSFLGSDPFLRIEAYGHHVVLTEGSDIRRYESTDPIDDLEQLLKSYSAATVPGLPRFCGGAVGFAGYDMVRYTERLPHPPLDDRQIPDLSFAFYDRMVIFDQINKT
ncbi:MAG: anthranilate synthase component I, partial [Planctomycetaceae bacterium]